jgi:tripartite-type tricarboxylate transporter receptor subunit TctC
MKHLLATAALLLASSAFAQTGFPAHQVTLVVPFTPGGGTDTGARVIAQKLSQKWGQPVIVENKGGAAGVIGADIVAKAKPDGYTILMGNIGTQSINPTLYKKLPYDPDKAFAAIGLVAELPLMMMVNAQLPVKTAQEFIAYAKANPGKLSYSTSGAGSSMHLAAELFKAQSGTFILHVPYRGGGPAVADLIAGHVELTFATVLEALGQVKSGRIRALAVTSDKRVSALPDTPTLSEAGLPGFNSISWIGLLAPAGTPSVIVEKISADLRAVLTDPEVKQKFTELGAITANTTPAQFQQLIDKDRKRYAQLILDKHITAE